MLLQYLVSPLTKSSIKIFNESGVEFEDGDKFPIVNNIPILLSKDNSLFSIQDVIEEKPQTQNKHYSDKRSFKNYIRRNILPTLTTDWTLKERYVALRNKLEGGKVLIIGAGDKVGFYKEIFQGLEIITSDVHMQFGPDIVFDVHQIPFSDNLFDLIIAGQVMEHTIRPWQVAMELQRIAASNGIIQIEVPFTFPYHGAPYDFFRFTFSGMRSLFPLCMVTDYKATEGIFSSAAVINSQVLLELSGKKYVKYLMLLTGRFLFCWLKYFDLMSRGKRLRDFIMPKGYCMTFTKDNKKRSDRECLDDFNSLMRH